MKYIMFNVLFLNTKKAIKSFGISLIISNCIHSIQNNLSSFILLNELFHNKIFLILISAETKTFQARYFLLVHDIYMVKCIFFSG